MPELVQPAASPALTTAPSAKQSPALGTAALVIALVPVIAYLIVSFYPSVFPAPADSFGWLFLAAAVLMVATPICGLLALILGIVAARRNRGRVAGIVAIIIGALALLYGIANLVIQAIFAAMFAATY